MIKAAFAFWPFGLFFFWKNVHCGSRAGRERRFFCFFSKSRVLFIGPTSTLLKKKKTLKLDLTVLFTYLKIILLQYF